jgi:hypothetical protein
MCSRDRIGGETVKVDPWSRSLAERGVWKLDISSVFDLV